MLYFMKDGERIECRPILRKGEVGQTVVLTNVVLQDHQKLAPYQQPTVFLIYQKHEEEGWYVLRDPEGKEVKVHWDYGRDLYDATAWAQWNDLRVREKLARKQRKIEHLEGVGATLKDILVRQGARLVTKEEAKALGIKL